MRSADPPPQRTLRRRKRWSKAWLLLLLIGPAIALRAATTLWPFLQTLWTSFHDASPMQPNDEWVGLENYRRMASETSFKETARFTIVFAVVSTILELAIGLAIAVLLQARFRGKQFARTVLLIPWAIPVVVVGVGFRFALDQDYGIIADALARVGVAPSWLLDVQWAKVSVILANVWRNVPFAAIVLLAALQSIPRDHFEAARVDGATGLQTMRYVVLPQMMPTVISVGTFFVIWQISSFDIIIAMTGGGPGSATQVLGYRAYLEGLGSLNFGRSTATSMVLCLGVAIVGLVGAGALNRSERRLSS